MSLSLTIPTHSCTACELADAFSTVCRILHEHELLTHRGYASFQKVIRELKILRNKEDWSFVVDLDDPIEFELAENIINQSDGAQILLSAKEISVDTSKDFPFKSWDISLLIKDLDENPIGRWHFDFANQSISSMQSGPLTHMQFGGHISGGNRNNDYSLKVPRWTHPPMDLSLLCEVIVANFFPDKWDLIKDDPVWCESISLSEKLCYSAYVLKLFTSLNTSGTTFLNEVEAKTWINKI